MSTGLPVDRHVVVIGGGIAGLVAALECARIGVRVSVLEAADRLGGCIRAEEVAGVRVDTGAESFATRGGTVRQLIEKLSLGDRVIQPAGAGAWLAFDDRAEPLPKAGILGIPSNPLADDVRRIIGWPGSLRAYLDRIRPVLTIGKEHDLAGLVEKRMGRAVLDSLVAPVTNGVYSADPSDLDVTRAAPGLNQALTVAGSLSGAVALLRENVPAGSAVGGFEGGMTVLVEALRAALVNYDARVVTGARATALEPLDDGRWRVTVSRTADGDESSVDADAVIVAVPERAAARLLGPHVPALAAEPIAEAPAVDIVTLAIDSADLDAHPRGTGVLTAASAGRTAKALTHANAKWPWIDAALDEHRHIVRVSFGRHGERSPLEGLSEAEVVDLARTEAAALLGVSIRPDQVADAVRTSWAGTLPRAFAGQKERSDRLRDAVTAVPGLDVTGAWLSGTGLASVIPDADAAAGRVRHRIVADALDAD